MPVAPGQFHPVPLLEIDRGEVCPENQLVMENSSTVIKLASEPTAQILDETAGFAALKRWSLPWQSV
jgi:hypothetical protein